MTQLFLFFVFLACIAISGGSYFFFSSGQQVTATMYMLGSILASVYFGLRWFNTSGNMNTTAAAEWSAPVNYCPDFLSLSKDSNGTQICIDTVGASTGGMDTSDGTALSGRTAFNLSLTVTPASSRAAALCDEAKSKGVTWEGVWNGTTCTGFNPPLPPTFA